MPRMMGNAGQAPGGMHAPGRRKPRVLRCWVDDSTTGDIGTEASVVTVVLGLRGIELQSASDLLLVNRTKSAVAATPSVLRAALTTPIQGRFDWEHGGVLVLSDGEFDQDCLNLIAETLGTTGEKVHTGGLEQLHWATAGKATVLVYLPVVGIPPITVAVVEAGGGVVLRGWPNTWSDEAHRGPGCRCFEGLGGRGRIRRAGEAPASAETGGAFPKGQPSWAPGAALWKEGTAGG